MRWIEQVWYDNGRGARALSPLAGAYGIVIDLRRRAYRRGLMGVERLPVPVVVVGNVAVGGTGKTPLVAALVERLFTRGWRPGIISRGYGGNAAPGPHLVGPDDDPAAVGDEPVLLARRSGCPVAVARQRAAAGRLLLETTKVDMLVADDGLQHYALARDVEIAVVDGVRRLGNGRLLPAGPLREPAARLRGADLVVINGGTASPGEVAMTLVGDRAVHLSDGVSRPLKAFQGEPIHALAGIGHPQRFFDDLAGLGLSVTAHPFPDHHRFRPTDVRFDDGRDVLMTEKDAVKCRAFAGSEHWYVPVEAHFDEAGEQALAGLLDGLGRRSPAT